ncbi:MAG TPA: ComF family protein [Bacteroidales bacterium]|nr:ComF family protein [Bacteroidales bacterium]
MTTFLNDFLALLFPRSCEICGNSLYKNEELICLHCLGHLPYTHWDKDPENPMHAVFWGKIPVQGVAAMLYFHRGNRVQKLMHKLKYKGVKEIGVYMGKRYGLQLKNAFPFSQIDLIMPVPLHPDKKAIRGYNQSEQFAIGLASSMQVKMDAESLYRKTASETQTRKSKIQRWENVKDIFEVKNPESFADKHILLVDDVITTGSTLEACAQILLKIPNVKISIAAIASAHK